MTPPAHPSDSLLLCPFCGGEAMIGGGGDYNVMCCDCPASTLGESNPEAIAAWNRRASAAPGGEDVAVAWRPDRESVARAMLDLFASLAGPPSWGDTLRAADAILALTAPPAKGGA